MHKKLFIASIIILAQSLDASEKKLGILTKESSAESSEKEQITVTTEFSAELLADGKINKKMKTSIAGVSTILTTQHTWDPKKQDFISFSIAFENENDNEKNHLVHIQHCLYSCQMFQTQSFTLGLIKRNGSEHGYLTVAGCSLMRTNKNW